MSKDGGVFKVYVFYITSCNCKHCSCVVKRLPDLLQIFPYYLFIRKNKVNCSQLKIMQYRSTHGVGMYFFVNHMKAAFDRAVLRAKHKAVLGLLSAAALHTQ